MKRSERRALEKEIQQLGMAESEWTPEQDARVMAKVKEQYELAMAAQKEKNSSKRGIGIGRRMLIVSATAVVLMVLSFAYAVFTPDAVSNAKGFVRQAAIWVNDTLQLGYDFEVPLEKQTQDIDDRKVFYTLEEAAANLPYDLAYFQDPEAALQMIEVVGFSSQYATILLKYQYQSATISIKMTNWGQDYYSSLESIDDDVVSWKNGNIFIGGADSFWTGATYYSGTEIFISTTSNISYSEFANLCQKLAIFN